MLQKGKFGSKLSGSPQEKERLSFYNVQKITSLAEGINESLTMLLSTLISELDLDLHRNSERKCLL